MTSWKRGIEFDSLSAIVYVIAIVGFELRSGEAAAIHVWALREWVVACQPFSNRPSYQQQTYQTLLFHSGLCHQFVSARELYCGWGT